MIQVVLAYVGPEAALPLLTVLAAIGGVLLVCWRWVASLFRRVWRMVFRGGAAAQDVPSPSTGATTTTHARGSAEAPVAETRVASASDD